MSIGAACPRASSLLLNVWAPLPARMQPLDGCEARVSVYVLAENMGTSVPVIESNYSHVNPEMVADELTME